MVISIITLSIAVLVLVLLFIAEVFAYAQKDEENEELKKEIKSYKKELDSRNEVIIDLRKSMKEAGMAYSKIYNEDI